MSHRRCHVHLSTFCISLFLFICSPAEVMMAVCAPPCNPPSSHRTPPPLHALSTCPPPRFSSHSISFACFCGPLAFRCAFLSIPALHVLVCVCVHGEGSPLFVVLVDCLYPLFRLFRYPSFPRCRVPSRPKSPTALASILLVVTSSFNVGAASRAGSNGWRCAVSLMLISVGYDGYGFNVVVRSDRKSVV